MRVLFTYGCLLGAITIVGCSGGSSSSKSSILDIQGRWAGECQVIAVDGNSERMEATVSESIFVIQEVNYLNNASCDGASFISSNVRFSFVVTGEVTELEDGDASHINFTAIGGTITASDAALAELESQGTNLQAFAAAQGVTGDIDNLTLSDLGLTQDVSYRIYRVDNLPNGDIALRISLINTSYDGSSEELRPISLDAENTLTKLPLN